MWNWYCIKSYMIHMCNDYSVHMYDKNWRVHFSSVVLRCVRKATGEFQTFVLSLTSCERYIANKNLNLLWEGKLYNVMAEKRDSCGRKRKSGTTWCSAPNCTNNKRKNPYLSFFRFPKDTARWGILNGKHISQFYFVRCINKIQ